MASSEYTKVSRHISIRQWNNDVAEIAISRRQTTGGCWTDADEAEITQAVQQLIAEYRPTEIVTDYGNNSRQSTLVLLGIVLHKLGINVVLSDTWYDSGDQRHIWRSNGETIAA